MDRFFDEAARILASPTSRRRALRLLGGALVGSIFALAGVRHAGAQQTCKASCTGQRKCCLGARGKEDFCIPEDQTCCGLLGCSSKEVCCEKAFVCAAQGETCCGGTKCGKDQTCCNNLTCCGKKQVCVKNGCAASNG